jgi:NAD(P)-dependent dehydrogenase (short-subunit alcohol dehydrogenase family)
MKLQGKVALVTGAARGLGRGYALRLAGLGADVVINDINLESAKEFDEELTAPTVMDEIRALGRRSIGIQCDAANRQAIEAMFQQILSEFGRIDILVNNAGGLQVRPEASYASTMPEEDLRRELDRNLMSCIFCCQAAIPPMKAQGGGNIINISSIYGFRGSLESHPAVPYNSTKGAVNLLTMNLAVKLAPYNIRVNAIAPGLFRTDINLYLEKPENKGLLASKLDWIPLRRMADVDDMKGAAVFLASEASAFITGHVLVVDGGFLAR